jgi:ADP-heptose:LPS heptosyltransferase
LTVGDNIQVFRQQPAHAEPLDLTGQPEVRSRARRGISGSLKHLRVTARGHLGRLLAAFRSPEHARREGALVTHGIASVLVCRVNARMGNALFLTALIQQLHELMPEASIDVASAYQQAPDLLGRLPGVRSVIVFPYKGVQLVWRYLAALARVRARRYDLVIDPTPNSTSSRIVLTLSRARLRLGFSSEHQWAPLTHEVPEALIPAHRAHRPVFLLREALGVAHQPERLRLSIGCDASEEAEARALLRRALTLQGHDRGAQPVGFFAYATGAKMLTRQYWLEFWAAFLKLAPEAVPVEILPTPNTAPLDRSFVALHVAQPRRLAAVMGQTCMFISADTGPMHLASSTEVPTVALFTASEPELYGPLKPSDLALDATRYAPATLARLCHSHWQHHRARSDL